MKKLKGDQESVEDKVGRKHIDDVSCVIQGGVEDLGGEDDTPGDDPDNREDDREDITWFFVVQISKHFCHFKDWVNTVVYKEHQCANTGKVGGPWEHYQGDGGDVVDKHLQEVLPLDIEELADGQWQVEGQLHHVVVPDVRWNLVK